MVADAHLNAAAPVDEERFLAFLDAVPLLGDSLLLAGDIYDFWFTYRLLVPRQCIRVTARLIELARRMPVRMIGGNHDRWGDTFWGPEAGITFAPRELRFPSGGRRILAIHGDGVHREQRVATMLNHVLDQPATIAVFRAIPAGVGFRIAKALGHSPEYVAAHPEVIGQAAARQLAWAEATMAADPEIDVLVMGHTHREAAREVSPGRWYVNPGAWLDGYRYAVVDDSTVALERFR